jgi:hypothetical protein
VTALRFAAKAVAIVAMVVVYWVFQTSGSSPEVVTDV